MSHRALNEIPETKFRKLFGHEKHSLTMAWFHETSLATWNCLPVDATAIDNTISWDILAKRL